MIHLQVDHKHWVESNFPSQPKELPAAGMVEETGELLHALIAKYRIARWGADKRYSLETLDADLFDAIGDCCIYLVSYCNAADWDFLALYKRVGRVTKASGMDHIAGGVALVSIAAQFYSSQTKQLASMYLIQLQQLAKDCGYEFEDCVLKTWDKVKERKR